MKGLYSLLTLFASIIVAIYPETVLRLILVVLAIFAFSELIAKLAEMEKSE